MNQELQTQQLINDELLLKITTGNLIDLSAGQLAHFYREYCNALGMNPITQPFTVITFKGVKQLYPGRKAAAQLNNMHKVSHELVRRWTADNIAWTEIIASTPYNKTFAIGGVWIGGLTGIDIINAVKKSETQAKIRGTLDVVGLGMPTDDEMIDTGGQKSDWQLPEGDDIEQTTIKQDMAKNKKRTKEQIAQSAADMKIKFTTCATLDELDAVTKSDPAAFKLCPAEYAAARNKLKEVVQDADIIPDTPPQSIPLTELAEIEKLDGDEGMQAYINWCGKYTLLVSAKSPEYDKRLADAGSDLVRRKGWQLKAFWDKNNRSAI